MPIPVHPHVRGDNFRGFQLMFHHSRFTPTCVGTMNWLLNDVSQFPVHPHVRGDNPTRRRGLLHPIGSPPRAWGQSNREPLYACLSRFTPTCVGTMASAVMWLALLIGSPPRAWGQYKPAWKRLGALRFTPTCVGTIADLSRADLSGTVHPHVRGDNLGLESDPFLEHGSPPRAWGQLDMANWSFGRLRFTPTCVGTMISQPGSV